MHEKSKEFAPSPWGFTMVRHAPSRNSRAYKLLGGTPATEIQFRLPGVRIEHIRAGRHTLCNLTAVTPIDENATEINHAIYWTMPWLTPLRPLLRPFVKAFLGQDRDIVAQQQLGLRHDPPLLLIDDSDTQAKWYYRLKAEYVRARAEGRASSIRSSRACCAGGPPQLKRRVELQVLVAVDRPHLDIAFRAVLPDGQRHLDPRRPLRPNLPIELGEIVDRLARNGGNDAAAREPGMLRRTVIARSA